MIYPIDIHKSVSGDTNQVLQNFRGIFQGIGLGPRLHISRYASAEGGVVTPSLLRRVHRHGGQRIGQQKSVMPPLIYLEDYADKEENFRESLGNPTSADITSEPRPPSKKTTEEPTL